ncbi:hypothetical protein KIW84_033241 [Lathyrus oleraceus]|uniref:Uncharacterized protein n=1 Tax=Pisum sativum TaxID=3888 RepID=A0A9D4Y048_PEA|nr:hypothetical protein KIW84_033241 [Pisum sativum]
MLENGQDVPLPANNSIVNIADVTKVTRSGRVFGPVFPKDVEDIDKKVEVPAANPVNAPKCQSGESSNLKPSDDDEVLRLIKKREFNMVEQLLQTPSKISVLSLLMNFEAHREALQKLLEKAYVEHDVTVDQFDRIVANITSCNNLSFCDEELPEESRNHNLALHISMNCKEDVLSNVLVDTGSLLNVLLKSTLSRLTYQGTPMRYSGMIVKAFDGFCKTVIGEVYLLVKIGPSDFQITFQKLKFVRNGKLVIVGGEKALLVSHLSSFSYVEAEDEIGTPFQALPIAEEKKVGSPMFSFKDAQKIVEDGSSDQSGRMVEVAENKNQDGLGFQEGSSVIKVEDVLVSKPIEYDDPTPSPNFEFPVFEVEEENDEEVSDDMKEVKIGSQLCPEAKKGLIDLLREYSDAFAWSYQDIPGLDSEIVEHRFPLKPECPPVKKKLRRTQHEMAVKNKEEVQK